MQDETGVIYTNLQRLSSNELRPPLDLTRDAFFPRELLAHALSKEFRGLRKEFSLVSSPQKECHVTVRTYLGLHKQRDSEVNRVPPCLLLVIRL